MIVKARANSVFIIYWKDYCSLKMDTWIKVSQISYFLKNLQKMFSCIKIFMFLGNTPLEVIYCYPKLSACMPGFCWIELLNQQKILKSISCKITLAGQLSFVLCELWQHWLWSFKSKDTKLVRHLSVKAVLSVRKQLT